MKKMLVVEDDILSQDLMRKIFKNDFEVDICDSGEEYYEKYSNVEYSIMIVDVSIKGKIFGLDLVKEIKSTDRNKNTPILCLTAHAQTRMRETAIESGSDLFMTKPVPNKVLKDAVEQLIHRHENQSAVSEN